MFRWTAPAVTFPERFNGSATAMCWRRRRATRLHHITERGLSLWTGAWETSGHSGTLEPTPCVCIRLYLGGGTDRGLSDQYEEWEDAEESPIGLYSGSGAFNCQSSQTTARLGQKKIENSKGKLWEIDWEEHTHRRTHTHTYTHRVREGHIFMSMFYFAMIDWPLSVWTVRVSNSTSSVAKSGSWSWFWFALSEWLQNKILSNISTSANWNWISQNISSHCRLSLAYSLIIEFLLTSMLNKINHYI